MSDVQTSAKTESVADQAKGDRPPRTRGKGPNAGGGYSSIPKQAMAILPRTAFAAVIALTTVAPASADIGSDLKNFWDRAGGGVNYTRPTAYQGQMGGYVTLGSLYVRTQPRSSGLLNIQLPSIRSGCGGIDIFGGAFSFISKEELIQLGKAIMQNASSYAFELALESLSPAVHEQMVKLRDLVQKVNAMNINSCEAGQLLTGSLWAEVDGSTQHVCKTIGTMSGKFADALSSRYGCGYQGKTTSTLAGASGAMKDQVPVDVNYAWKAIKKNALLAGDARLAELFMTMSGTIITRAAANDNEGPRHQVITPMAFTGPMVQAFVEGGTIRILRCDETEKCLNPTMRDITIARSDAFFARVKTIVQGIANALRDDTKLSNDAVGLIGMTSVPVYDTLKTAVAYKHRFSDDEVALMSELVAIDFAMTYTQDAMQEMAKSASNTDAFGDQIEKFQSTIGRTLDAFSVYRQDAQQKYQQAIASLEKLAMSKAVLASAGASKFAGQMGVSK